MQVSESILGEQHLCCGVWVVGGRGTAALLYGKIVDDAVALSWSIGWGEALVTGSLDGELNMMSLSMSSSSGVE